MRFIFFVLIAFPSFLFAQKKEYKIVKIDTPPTIDGIITDEYWGSVQSANNFISYTPVSGEPISNNFNTEWKAVYDNQAIYFAVYMYDKNADSIMTQYCKRDNIYGSNNDFVTLLINPYADGQTDFSFSLTPYSIQEDEKIGQDYQDKNWDMVWQAEATITENGWFAEFKIPYSAIRFPKKDIQDWSFNIKRHIRRNRSTFSWNELDLTRNDISNQAGIIKGLSDIEPPLRLSFSPYVSAYVTDFENETDFAVNGGVDLKYGINESFTLDMTLIPDFGQVGFDNQVLNLSPFEVQYDEKRPFFTEGTELYNKSGLFYSRRISDNLLNASKISGKTKKNLGVGVLNAITSESENNPLSNYNIITLDQSIHSNSYVSLTNTNVIRTNDEWANVTGLNSSLKNKSNKFQLSSTFNLSNVHEDSLTTTGFASNINFSKIAGRFQFYLGNNIESDTYDPNDMGFLYNNNEVSSFGGISYKIDKPSSYFVEFKSFLNANIEYLYQPYLFSNIEIEAKQVSTFTNYLTWVLSADIVPVEEKDFFESRTGIDDVFIRSESYKVRTYFSSDYRKTIAIDLSLSGGKAPLYDEETYSFRLSPRIRLSDKLFMYYVFSTKTVDNATGYISTFNETPIYSIRKEQFFTNVLSAEYVLNNKMSFDLKFRHHWQQVENYSFHELDSQGYLKQSTYNDNENVNFNAWNIDLNFSYWFAPGSELTVVWKNGILNEGNRIYTYYTDNLEALLEQAQENSLSLRLRYYLDYQNLKKK
ncbi:MAG: DUF5916 domain-containing protein [Flavobacteriales bacterium]